MKILVLSHRFSPDIGGIEVISEILATEFSKCSCDIHLVTWTPTESQKRFQFKIIRNPNPVILFREFLWADVVLENNLSLRLSWPLLFVKRRHVIAVHTWIRRINGEIGVRDRLKFFWLQKANSVIAVSRELKKETLNTAQVIHNPYRDNLFTRTNRKERKKDFIFLGRLVSDKGADMAISLIKMLNDHSTADSKKYTLSVVGDGPEKKTLENQVKDLSLEHDICFTGYLQGKELVEFLNEHKYLLVPSRWKEPFGNIVLEGMACGCLPVVSNGGGLPEAVGDAGIIFKRNDLQSFYENVRFLLNNPTVEGALRKNFSKHLDAHRSFTISKAYQTVLEQDF